MPRSTSATYEFEGTYEYGSREEDSGTEIDGEGEVGDGEVAALLQWVLGSGKPDAG